MRFVRKMPISDANFFWRFSGSAFVAFLGAATEEVRAQTLQQWRVVCQLPEAFEVLTFLASETDHLNWKAEGLPHNKLALENGAILFAASAASRTPFVVDPTGAVSAFLATHFKNGSTTEVLRANQSDLLTQVKRGMGTKVIFL